MEERQYWAFTFMGQQGATLGTGYVLLYGKMEETRAALFALIGDQWAFQYPYKGPVFQNALQEFNLTQLPLNLAVQEVHDGP